MVVRGKRVALRRYIIPLGFVCCLFFVNVSSAKMSVVSPVSKDSEVGVAKWSVDVTASGNSNMTLDAGGSGQTYSLTVTNNSDIVSAYSIKVSNIPTGVKIGLDITADSDLVTPVAGEVVFTNTGGDLGYEAPNNSRTHVLTLVAESTAEITQNSVNVVIDVLLMQKDPRL